MTETTDRTPREIVEQTQPGSLAWLVAIMRTLLAPGGCPWDREQTLSTLRPYLIEECYEVLEALDSGDRELHCEELGDLLLQIVFQSELAGISIAAIIRAIGDKLIRRHPHVFGDTSVSDAEEVLQRWEAIKAQEPSAQRRRSRLDGIPVALPALQRCAEITRKASRVEQPLETLAAPRERLGRQLSAIEAACANDDREQLHCDVGDALFAAAQWAQRLGIEPEQALRDATRRFEQHFRQTEQANETQTADQNA